MKQKRFSFLQRIKCFKYAFNGLRVLIREEHNARIHVVAACVVVMAGFIFHLSCMEWIVVMLCIGFVFSLELINSAIENIADFVSPARHEQIKKIKDLSAAAVLVGAFVSLITAMIIFLPKIIIF